MKFYENLDYILQNKHISKREMCHQIRLSYNTFMSAYHRKSKKISFETMLNIAQFLGCDVETLLNSKPEIKKKKVVLITGASGDIGSAIAKKLSTPQTIVLLTYNSNKSAVLNIQKQLPNNCESEIYACNLTQANTVEKMVEYFIKKYKTIDVLVNCAGVSLLQQIQDTTEHDFNRVFNSNVKSTIFTTKCVSRHMISNKFGKIINISSVWGLVGASVESVYSASKGAINSLTLALAKELAPSGITVNCICPGFIWGKMNSCFSKEEVEEIANNIPLNRVGTPTDVANLVEFLCSENASYITGQIIAVDGGMIL